MLKSFLCVVALIISHAKGATDRHIVAPRSYVVEQSVYQHYETMFGVSLRSRVSSASVLASAVAAVGITEGSTLLMGCTAYADGGILGRAVRARDGAVAQKAQLRAFLVSRKENLICFLYRWLPDELLTKFKFSAYPVPSLLRVHPFIYTSIDRLSRLSTLPTVPRVEVPAAAAADVDGGKFHLHIMTFASEANGLTSALSLIKNLRAYDLGSFDRFFWSDEGTQRFTADMLQKGATHGDSHYHYADTSSMDLDNQRAKTWGRLSNVLRQFVSSDGATSLSVADPCSLATIEPRVTLGKITLSVSHLMDHQNPQLGAACISYIVAHMTSAPNSPVFNVGLVSRERLLNNNARSIVEGSGIGNSFQTYTSQSLLGNGQVVQVADTGVDAASCYFADTGGTVTPSDINSGTPNVDSSKRKIISYVYAGSQGDETDGPDGHGTHVAGSIAGNIENADVNSIGQYDGVASGAKLAVLDLAAGTSESLAIPNSADLLFGSGYAAGARVHSNSWGAFFSAGDAGYYSSSDIDGYLFNHPDSTVFFAAGNGGDVAGAVSMQGQSKNVVAVGSSETTRNSVSIDNVAYYSSFGPAYDGRFKPDVVCPGDELKSAKSQGDGSQTCGTINKTGTSQATPICAGTAALVRQYFSDSAFFETFCSAGLVSAGSGSCASFEPSGVLVKAVLLHSGTPLSLYHFGDAAHDQQLGSPPDNTQGFGRVTLKNVLPLPNLNAEYLFTLFVQDQQSLNSDSSASFSLDVTDSNVPLKLTLVWYDPPNQDGITTSALLHDLDLELTGPGGERHVGNGQNNGDTQFDSINTNEVVRIMSPAEGAWTATVYSRSLVAADSQSFSVIITLGGSVNGGGGGGGGGNPPPPPTAAAPNPDDDYQKPGQEMVIKPSSALTKHPDDKCQCPLPTLKPSLLQSDSLSSAPATVARTAVTLEASQSPSSAPGAKTSKPIKKKKMTKEQKDAAKLKLKLEQASEEEALSVDWVQVVHSDDGDPRHKHQGPGPKTRLRH